MKSEQWVRARLKKIETQMAEQVDHGMQHGWPVPFWDRNCVEREALRRVLGMRLKPFCAADTMAGV